eukprot:1816609-Alexandrium_andersonii.AAC.1
MEQQLGAPLRQFGQPNRAGNVVPPPLRQQVNARRALGSCRGTRGQASHTREQLCKVLVAPVCSVQARPTVMRQTRVAGAGEAVSASLWPSGLWPGRRSGPADIWAGEIAICSRSRARCLAMRGLGLVGPVRRGGRRDCLAAETGLGHPPA